MGARRGVLALVAADGAVPVSPGAALLEEMLAGWRCQQQARRLTARLIGERERGVVRQFTEFTGRWPWQWTAAQAEAWVASGGWAHSTVRSYQGALALFLEYVCDPRYGWVSECRQRVGAVLVQVFQRVQPLEQHRLHHQEVTRDDRVRLGGQEPPPGRAGPAGRRSIPAARRIAHTVDAATVYPKRASSPWILRCIHAGFSCAIRRINLLTGSPVDGRPGRRRSV
jgi:hypothetical protein